MKRPIVRGVPGFDIPGSLRGAASRATGPISESLDILSGKDPSWLASTKDQMQTTGGACEIYDSDWNLVWVSPELKAVVGTADESELGYGEHIFEVYQRPVWRARVNEGTHENAFREALPYIMYDSAPRVREIQNKLESDAQDLINTVDAVKPPPVWSLDLELILDGMPETRVHCMHVRLYDKDERFQGTARIYGPGMRASLLSLVARGDEGLFERMSRLVSPGRQRAAILFADLEGSVKLSRRLPSSVYFYLISSLIKAMDEIIVRHSGLVGKHAGDGMSAFFLADGHEHEHVSATVRACVAATYDIQEVTQEISRRVAQETGIHDLECKMNIGVHWGSTIYMGQIGTGGRLEVTALGDEVNECARIEEAAKGGVTLASKSLLERLNEHDARALGVELSSTTYFTLDDVEDIPEKAEWDAGKIPVTQLSQ